MKWLILGLFIALFFPSYISSKKIDFGDPKIRQIDLKNSKIIFVWAIGKGKLIKSTQLDTKAEEVYTKIDFLRIKSKYYKFNRPTGLSVDKDENVFVIERLKNIIRVYSSSGEYKRTIGSGRGLEKLDDPSGIGFYRSGKLFIPSTLGRMMQVFSNEGRLITEIPLPFRPGKVGIYGSNIYIAGKILNDEKYCVYKYTATGSFLNGIGAISKKRGSEEKLFHDKKDFTIDTVGHLYLVNHFQSRIEKYTPKGELLNVITFQPTIKHKRNRITDVLERKTIHEEETKGSGIEFKSGIGQGGHIRMNYICYSIGIDSKNYIYVLGPSDHTKPMGVESNLYLFSPEEEYLERVVIPVPCTQIHIDSSDQIYFLSSENNRFVFKYKILKRYIN